MGRRPRHARTTIEAVPDWVVWMVAAALLTAGEVVTLGFFLGPVALAAALAAVAAAVGLEIEGQVAVFVVGSVASLALVRPVARRHLHAPARLRTGADALVGCPAVVLEQVDAEGGAVRLRGEVWSARAFDEDRVLEPGTRVEVLQIQGATALVSD